MYLLAAGAAWVLYPIQAALVYMALWVFAVVTDAPMGGPLAGPFLVLLVGAVGLVLTIFVVVPSLVAGEVIGRRLGWGWSVPGALGGAVVLTGILACGWALGARATVPLGAITWAVSLGLTVLPLGAAGLVLAAGSTAPKAIRRILRGGRRANRTI